MKQEDVFIFGRKSKVCYLKTGSSRGSVSVRPDGFYVKITDFRRARTFFRKWLRKEAGLFIKKRVKKWAFECGIEFRRIFIKQQRTCWGSCSQRKNLNFNWKLIHLPIVLVDYVIIHELMHLKELNHSKNFWELVANKCPGYKDLRKTLKKIPAA